MMIKVKVIAGSKFQKIEKTNNSENCEYKVFLKKLPEKGKANEELIKILSVEFKTPQKLIKIIKGKTSKYKIIKLDKDG